VKEQHRRPAAGLDDIHRQTARRDTPLGRRGRRGKPATHARPRVGMTCMEKLCSSPDIMTAEVGVSKLCARFHCYQ
jgi:hypothetical protein